MGGVFSGQPAPNSPCRREVNSQSPKSKMCQAVATGKTSAWELPCLGVTQVTTGQSPPGFQPRFPQHKNQEVGSDWQL